MMANLTLTPGRWLGRGSYLHRTVPGDQIECSFELAAESVGAHIKGVQTQRDGSANNAFACWITANDTGTYDIAAQFGSVNVTGSAKLESYPNLGLLWSKEGDVQVAFSLFELRGSRGFRGFFRSGETLLSWEMMLDLHGHVGRKRCTQRRLTQATQPPQIGGSARVSSLRRHAVGQLLQNQTAHEPSWDCP
ncbi:MAG: hypothetical protein HC809_05735 [Gammaproteobacteria bacterium]|nr:hypothetical protein [Gammaproteobacteria bacterium]